VCLSKYQYSDNDESNTTGNNEAKTDWHGGLRRGRHEGYSDCEAQAERGEREFVWLCRVDTSPLEK
jgi:hypothetical protein